MQSHLVVLGGVAAPWGRADSAVMHADWELTWSMSLGEADCPDLLVAW